MKTRRSILGEHVAFVDTADGIIIHPENELDIEDGIFAAMDEWAAQVNETKEYAIKEMCKEEAISFSRWLGENYDFNEFEQSWGKFWEEEGQSGFDAMDIHELYKVYKND